MQQEQRCDQRTISEENAFEQGVPYLNQKTFFAQCLLNGPDNRFCFVGSDEQSAASRKQRQSTTSNPAGGPFDNYWRPERLEKFWLLPIPSRSLMEAHSWNFKDCSTNIFIDSDPFTLHRLPIAQSTDAIRGKVGFSKGFHVWEIIWPMKLRGTHAVIGVGTKNARLHSCGYVSLVGSDSESYGWDIVRQKCLNGPNIVPWSYPLKTPNKSFYHGNILVPDRILCMLDMDNGYLAFSSFRQYYGVAFTGLKGKTLFPMISSVWGHCEIKMIYMGSLPPEPRSLKDICRGEVRALLRQPKLSEVQKLQLPREVVRYLLHS